MLPFRFSDDSWLKFIVLFLSAVLFFSAEVFAKDVREFGVKGDGKSDDTEASDILTCGES